MLTTYVKTKELWHDYLFVIKNWSAMSNMPDRSLVVMFELNYEWWAGDNHVRVREEGILAHLSCREKVWELGWPELIEHGNGCTGEGPGLCESLGHGEFGFYPRCSREPRSVLNRKQYHVAIYHLKRLLWLLCK